MVEQADSSKKRDFKAKQAIIDAIISIWSDKGQDLRFIDIHRSLVEKGIVQKDSYHYKTVRILEGLQEKGIIEKVRRGKYRLKLEPEEFHLFDRLNKLREEEDVSASRVGGFFWTACELNFLGLPDYAQDYNYVKTALEILGARISRIFNALRALAIEVYSKGKNGSLPKAIIRELVLELPAYYLGSKAGIDFDGLPLDKLMIAEKMMLHAVPKEIEDEDRRWVDATRKERMLEDIAVLEKLASRNLGQTEYDEEDVLIESLMEKAKPKHFALIVTQAEHIIDEEGYDKREIIRTIKQCSTRKAFDIAFFLLWAEKEKVFHVLQTRGYKYLGEKALDVQDYYEKLLASREIARALHPIMFHMYRTIEHKEAVIDDQHVLFIQELSGLKLKARKLARKYGTKAIISFLPFQNEFGGPTPEKEIVLARIFSNTPKELIHEWLSLGEKQFRKLGQDLRTDLVESIDSSE